MRGVTREGSETRWHGVPPDGGPGGVDAASPTTTTPPEPGQSWTRGRVGYLLAFTPAVLLVLALQPGALPLLVPGILVVCVADHARWVDGSWLSTVAAAVIAASTFQMHDPWRGSASGPVARMDSIIPLSDTGWTFELAGSAFVFSLPFFFVAFALALPALLAPLVRYAAQARRERRGAPRVPDPADEPVPF